MNLKGRNFSLELVVLQKFIEAEEFATDRKSTRPNSSHGYISHAVFCSKKKSHAGFTCPCASYDRTNEAVLHLFVADVPIASLLPVCASPLSLCLITCFTSRYSNPLSLL